MSRENDLLLPGDCFLYHVVFGNNYKKRRSNKISRKG